MTTDEVQYLKGNISTLLGGKAVKFKDITEERKGELDQVLKNSIAPLVKSLKVIISNEKGITISDFMKFLGKFSSDN